MSARLQQLGYEIERGQHGQPEIKGYTQEYLEASSPRRKQIQEHLEKKGLHGAKAAQIAAHQTRDAKQALSRDEVRAQHQQLAAEHGNQPEQVLTASAHRIVMQIHPERSHDMAQGAVTFARERAMERTAVADERALMRDALKHSMGDARLPEIRAEFERRVQDKELIEVERKPGFAGRAFTTAEMQAYERKIAQRMHAGQCKSDVLVNGECRKWAATQHPHLSESQKAAVSDVLTNRDRMMGLEGLAGTGKTTSLAAIREAAMQGGYEIIGLAPTSRAAQKLAEAGMNTETLQRHLTRGNGRDDGEKRLYIVDESSMVSTKQMHTFIERLKKNDRVLFVGDTRQHEAVEAGRPYAQLQDAGMQTTRLEEIIRQEDPALKAVVVQLANGEVKDAIASLDRQGRIHEIEDRSNRIEEIAREYVRKPADTLVISPDNQSRREINACIHRAMQQTGLVKCQEHSVRVLHVRQEMTGADRQHASSYERDDIIRYTKGSASLGIAAGEYTRVVKTDREGNMVTVARKNGAELSYDPRRLQGVTVFREAERAFAEGDRVQLTAPYHAQKLANRELGTVVQIDGDGNLRLRMDSGRKVEFNARQHPHLDHGYAVTSHSSQGHTADRVLVHVDSEHIHRGLINERMAYVSISRARHDVQIFTNDAETLGKELGKDISHSTALQPNEIRELMKAANHPRMGQSIGFVQ